MYEKSVNLSHFLNYVDTNKYNFKHVFIMPISCVLYFLPLYHS